VPARAAGARRRDALAPGVKRLVLSLFAAAVLAYGSMCALLFFSQRSMLYFPAPAAPVPGAQSHALESGGETLRIWGGPVAGARALVYFGGNAEDVGGNFASFARAMPDRAIYLVNYRGYGGSSGTPTEAGLFNDALAVYDWARQRHASIAVVGASLGSGVATYLAASREVERLVLVTPFDSIANVARSHYRLFPVALLMKDKFDSAARVSAVKAKTLIVVAGRDEVIPRARTDALIAKFPAGQVRVEVIEGATHNSVAESPRYLEAIARFLGS
jgi:uncharacterized protein